jgi:hypothetical protein
VQSCSAGPPSSLSSPAVKELSVLGAQPVQLLLMTAKSHVHRRDTETAALPSESCIIFCQIAKSCIWMEAGLPSPRCSELQHLGQPWLPLHFDPEVSRETALRECSRSVSGQAWGGSA